MATAAEGDRSLARPNRSYSRQLVLLVCRRLPEIFVAQTPSILKATKSRSCTGESPFDGLRKGDVRTGLQQGCYALSASLRTDFCHAETSYILTFLPRNHFRRANQIYRCQEGPKASHMSHIDRPASRVSVDFELRRHAGGSFSLHCICFRAPRIQERSMPTLKIGPGIVCIDQS